MRHSNSGKKLGRTPSHRKALFRNMASAMITYGKIRTTEVKAKELRRVVEPLITLAHRNDLHTRSSSWRPSFSHTKAVFLPYNEGGNEDCGRRGTYGYLAGYGTKSIRVL